MNFELTDDILKYLKDSEEETLQLTEALCKIPAPSWHEEKRAEFCKNWLTENGAEGVIIDDALNVIYPVGCDDKNDIILFIAHTDTVFPDTEPMPFSRDDEYMYAPGVGDDTVCVAELMIMARYVAQNKLKAPCGIVFAANAGEEGLGNLKGIKKIMETYGKRVKEMYTFDASYRFVSNRCVGSHRYEITFETEGGHSFNAFGNRNAIHAMSDLVCKLYQCEVPVVGNSKTTYNVGGVEGGTSVNTIAQKATMLYEYRSDNIECLAKMQKFFEDTIEQAKAEGKAEITVKTLGIRPCQGDVDEAHLAAMTEKVIRVSEKHSGIPCKAKCASTDCNIPMSMGIPAVAAGCYIGSGTHTREEKVLISSVPIGLKIVAELVLGYFEN